MNLSSTPAVVSGDTYLNTNVAPGRAGAVAYGRDGRRFRLVKAGAVALVPGVLVQGAVPVAIAAAHDHLTGGGFDLPPVEPIFNSYVGTFGLAERLSFTPGNFFTDPLPRADVLVMGHILHDWQLDQKRLLLQKAYDALPTGGALIVHEAIIDDERRHNAFGLLMSLNMLIEGPGFDFTGADCRGWIADAGFSTSYVEHLAGPDSMVVGIK